MKLGNNSKGINESKFKDSFDYKNNNFLSKSLDNSKAKIILSILESKESRYILKFSFLDTIKIFLRTNFCFSQKLMLKSNLYKKSYQTIEEYFDICNLLNKLEELEKLKIILFDKEQLSLFNFISKELISFDLEKLNSMSHLKNFNKNKENCVQMILKFLENYKLNNNITSDVNQKLYDLLDADLRE